MQRVYDIYKSYGPCTARDAMNFAGIPVNERYWVKIAQGRLLRAKRLVALPNGRFPKYKVVERHAQG